MRRKMRLLMITLLVFFTTPALGQESLKRQIARKHFELGEKMYKISDYPGALVEFEKAYKLAAEPGLLHNIGRCHESMGNHHKAIEYFEQYLQQKPEANNREQVLARIVNLKKMLERKAPVEPVPVKPAPVKPAPLAQPKPSPGWCWGCWPETSRMSSMRAYRRASSTAS